MWWSYLQPRGQYSQSWRLARNRITRTETISKLSRNIPIEVLTYQQKGPQENHPEKKRNISESDWGVALGNFA